MTFILRGTRRGLQKLIGYLARPCRKMDPSEKGRLGFISREPLPERTAFTATPWSPNQKLFVTYRVVCAVFTLAILIWSVPTDSNRWITFYSNWMYATLTLHFCWSATICLQQYCSTHEGPSQRTLYIGWIIYDMAMTISLTVSAEYWFSPWPVTIGLRSILRHGLNSVMVVIDVLLCGIPSRMNRVIYPVIHQGFYSVFVVLYWLGGFRGYDGKQYIYSFLDLNTVPLQAIGILLANTFIVMPVFHALVCALYRARLKLLKKFRNKNNHKIILKGKQMQTVQTESVNGKIQDSPVEQIQMNGVAYETV
ncbi:protein rolling stone-like [Branchiostoma floridae]|uniref:Protein rolling stone-like n=1 Tax=Branchiostoma floridae TaxID=7739 RepID=A0A9J7MSX4_BRAFL|nr:protein rolling stone-like [Branchiostoma floridae]